MDNRQYFIDTNSQYVIRHLRAKVERLESGEEYVRLKDSYEKELARQDARIRQLEKENASLKFQIKINREHWMEVNEDVLKEAEKQIAKSMKEVKSLERKLNDMARQRDKALDERTAMKAEVYDLKCQLMESDEKIAALRGVINKDSTNSSKPSSTDPNRKRISNSREKSGRNPGGQPGHEHHGRRRHRPEHIIQIPPKEEYLDADRYTPTGKTIRKQVVGISIRLDVTEYETPEFRNNETGQRVHADFPSGIKDDVTYDGTVKAAAYLMNNGCNVSIGNTRRVFSEFTHGELNLSAGMISKLKKEFSEKSENERNEIYKRLMSHGTMHADFTFGRCNGKTSTVLILANEDDCLYMMRPKKGKEGVKGTPLEVYDGIVISDHESAIANCGTAHQECLSHIQRYAQASIDNEPDRTWGEPLKKWISKSIDCWKQAREDGGVYDQAEVETLLRERDEIVGLGLREYADVPPGKYFRDGYNLLRRMDEDKEEYTLFLRNNEVAPTNNLAERLARQYKRKNHQVITFRSESGNSQFCDGLTIIQNARMHGDNLYDTLVDIFNT